MNDRSHALKRRLSYISRDSHAGQKSSRETSREVSRESCIGSFPSLPDPQIRPDPWKRVGRYTYVRDSIEEIPLKNGPYELIRLEGFGRLEDIVFFDIETTGLSGGAGSIAFLIGMAWKYGAALKVEQVFLSDFPGEEEFLDYLSKRLLPEKLYISYNGKCFDSHVLKTRYVMNGSQLSFPLQLDLLYPSRRFWKSITGACDLATIEDRILGIRRNRDIPGYEVPEAYFNFLKTGQTESISLVFDHNYQDILSLVHLMNLIEGIITRGQAPASFDMTGLGTYLLDRGEERGLSFLRSAFHLGDNRAGRILSLYLKRNRNWPQAVSIWKKMALRNSPFALIELAKYYEHRELDPSQALEWLARVEPYTVRERMILPELNKRKKRLHDKMGRAVRANTEGPP